MKPLTCALCACTILIASSAGLCAPLADPGRPSVQNGGVGRASQQDMEALRSQYRLRMTFAERGTGAYLAGVTVVIEHGNNQSELRFHDCGPLFFVAADPGTYGISATYGGVTQRRAAISVASTAVAHDGTPHADGRGRASMLGGLAPAP